MSDDEGSISESDSVISDDDDKEELSDDEDEDVLATKEEIPETPTVESTILRINPFPQTPNIIYPFERANIISTRAALISKYNNPLIDTANCLTVEDMAEKEFKERVFPLAIQREIGSRLEIINNKIVKVIYVEVIDPNHAQH
jgi:DNA-directed RNA polymerase subunit K/omega